MTKRSWSPRRRRLALDSEGICMGHDTDTREGWQEVLPRRGPRRPTSSPSSMMAPRPIPAWLHGRCCRCLAYGHRAAVCRDPLRCSRCLENGHCARECRNPCRPLSSLPCLDVPHVSRLSAVHRVAPASCEGSVRSTLPSKALHRGSWASAVSAAAGSAIPSGLMLQSALADHTTLLQGCVARVESFLERAEVALGRLSLVPTLLQTTLTSHSPCAVGVGSAEDRGEELYGSFSPLVGVHSSSVSTFPPMVSSTEGESIAVLLALVLQIMPELRELCRVYQ
uniref:CCHC-type domain-containing protein n=1 Tax=Aegilops tauschii subsp. strangulata TaxID=200361 RepID=A0A453TBB2_AEGTS